MCFIGLQTEKITAQMERANLPAAVDKHLVGAHRPADDHVEVLRRLSLAINLDIARVRGGCVRRFQQAEKREF